MPGVKENVYFQAAQAIGSSRRRSLLRHVLPNVAAPIIIRGALWPCLGELGAATARGARVAGKKCASVQ